MKLSNALLLMGAVACPVGARPTPFLDNFKVIVDSKSFKGGRSRGYSTTTLNGNNKFNVDDVKTLIESVRREAGDIGDKVWTETNSALEKVKEMTRHLENYSKAEIGAYVGLALSLTIAMKGTLLSSW